MTGIELIIARLPSGAARKSPARRGIARSYRAQCPVCGGHGLPLSIAETSDGKPLLHCFAGCEPEKILQSLGLSFADILPGPLPENRGFGGPEKWGGLFSALDALFSAHVQILSICTEYLEPQATERALDAILRSGELMEKIRKMAREIVREGGKK